MTKAIWFDMDGTIANLYGVTDWLTYLQNENTYPYAKARTMINFSIFARILHKLQEQGWKIGIISWTSKNGSESYNLAVEMTKRAWLAQHLPSVVWDEIRIVRYGTNKYMECGNGILFDDEKNNRSDWKDISYDEKNILKILQSLLTNK